jgi:hypothetical protein
MNEETELRIENVRLREYIKVLLNCLEKLEFSEYASPELKKQVFGHTNANTLEKIRQEVR